MKPMKENNFLKEFRNYKQAKLDAIKDKSITPFICYDPKLNFYFTTRFFTQWQITNLFKSIIIK